VNIKQVETAPIATPFDDAMKEQGLPTSVHSKSRTPRSRTPKKDSNSAPAADNNE
jgi:hypothetical protein